MEYFLYISLLASIALFAHKLDRKFYIERLQWNDKQRAARNKQVFELMEKFEYIKKIDKDRQAAFLDSCSRNYKLLRMNERNKKRIVRLIDKLMTMNKLCAESRSENVKLKSKYTPKDEL